MNKKDLKPIWIFLGVSIIASTIIGFVVGAIAGIKGIDVSKYNNTLNALSLIISNTIISIVLLINYFPKLKKDAKKLSKKNILQIVITAIVLIAINEIVSRIFIALKINMDNQNAITSYLAIYRLPIAFTITFLSPFIEEMVFRYSLETACKSKKTFIILSSALFGLAHGVGIVTILYIFIGYVLSLVYIKNDKNVIAPILVHFLNNLIATIEMIFLI